jgi:hypothetical protein
MAIDARISNVYFIVQFCAGPLAQELHRIVLLVAAKGAIEPLIPVSPVLV